MNQNELLDYFLARKESEEEKLKIFNEQLSRELQSPMGDQAGIFFYRTSIFAIRGKLEAYQEIIEAING